MCSRNVGPCQLVAASNLDLLSLAMVFFGENPLGAHGGLPLVLAGLGV